LRLSKRTEYGLRALVHLGRLADERFVQSRDLAKAENLPGKYVELVLMALRRADLLKSRAGVGGGYRLARSPAHIRVADVIDLLERADDADRVDSQSPGEHAVSFIVSRLDQVIGKALGELTLEKLLDQIPRGAAAKDSMYYI
jgi:Rrf2 family protein